MNKGTFAASLGSILGASTLLNGCGPSIQYASLQQRDPRMAAAGAIFGAAMHDYEVANYQRGQASTPRSRSLSNIILLCDSVDAARDGDPTSLSMADISGEKRDNPAVFFQGGNIGLAATFVNPAGPALKNDGWFKKSDGTNFFAPDRPNSVCNISIYDSNGKKVYSNGSAFSGSAALDSGLNFNSNDFAPGSYRVVGTIDGNTVSSRTFEIVSRQ